LTLSLWVVDLESMGCLDPVPRSGFRDKKMKKKIILIITLFEFFQRKFPFAAHTNPEYLTIFSSVAEPHHVDVAPASCKNFDAAPTLVRILLLC
jgi:hypothetical protein